MLCLLSKRSFEKSQNILRRPSDMYSHLTPFHLTVFSIALADKGRAKTTCRTTLRNRFKQVCEARLNFSKLVFELLHLTQKIEPLHYPCVHLKQTIPNDDSLVCMCVFSAACNLDSGKSSNTCHNLPVLLLLSKH